MIRLRVFGRFLKLLIGFAVPLAAVGACLLGLTGAIALAGAFVFLLLMASLAAESVIVRSHRVVEGETGAGLDRSLEHALEGAGRLPRIRIYEEPAPNAVVVRSFFGKGTILVSRGLVALLDERE